MVSTRSKPTSQNPQIGPQTVLSRPLENFKAVVLKLAVDNLARRLTAEEVARIEEGIAGKAELLSRIPDHPPYAAGLETPGYFKVTVLNVAADNLARRLMAAVVARIEEGISGKAELLSRIPDHPPYAAMIHEALLELNNEGGSSEESISDFIKKEYPDLPWAHSAYLKHHLGKLCTSQEIFVNSDNLYHLVDENTPDPASLKSDKPQSKPRKTRGRSRKKQDKAKEIESTSGLEVVVREEQNELAEEKSEAVESGQRERKPIRIKFQLPENRPTIDTIVSDLPLAVIVEDQNVLDCSVLGGSSKTPLDIIENGKKIQGRQLKPAYRYEKPEAPSTTALILNLAQPNNQPHEKVKCRGRGSSGRGRGRPRKNELFGEREAENFQNQEQPRRRGRPKKEKESENFQTRQQPGRVGRPRKLDSSF